MSSTAVRLHRQRAGKRNGAGLPTAASAGPNQTTAGPNCHYYHRHRPHHTWQPRASNRTHFFLHQHPHRTEKERSGSRHTGRAVVPVPMYRALSCSDEMAAPPDVDIAVIYLGTQGAKGERGKPTNGEGTEVGVGSGRVGAEVVKKTNKLTTGGRIFVQPATRTPPPVNREDTTTLEAFYHCFSLHRPIQDAL